MRKERQIGKCGEVAKQENVERGLVRGKSMDEGTSQSLNVVFTGHFCLGG